jgi:hypothetical protein
LIKEELLTNVVASCRKGQFYGMGYLDSDAIITVSNQIKEDIKPYKTNQYSTQLVLNYAKNILERLIF